MISVRCPDCKRGTIQRGDRCEECGLSWDALLDAERWANEHGKTAMVEPAMNAGVDPPERRSSSPPSEQR